MGPGRFIAEAGLATAGTCAGLSGEILSVVDVGFTGVSVHADMAQITIKAIVRRMNLSIRFRRHILWCTQMPVSRLLVAMRDIQHFRFSEIIADDVQPDRPI